MINVSKEEIVEAARSSNVDGTNPHRAILKTSSAEFTKDFDT
jgi:hypothetical protein